MPGDEVPADQIGNLSDQITKRVPLGLRRAITADVSSRAAIRPDQIQHAGGRPRPFGQLAFEAVEDLERLGRGPSQGQEDRLCVALVEGIAWDAMLGADLALPLDGLTGAHGVDAVFGEQRGRQWIVHPRKGVRGVFGNKAIEFCVLAQSLGIGGVGDQLRADVDQASVVLDWPPDHAEPRAGAEMLSRFAHSG